MPASTNAFLEWFKDWGQVVYFFVQILFWVSVSAAALMIALQYKRFVSHKLDVHGARHADRSAAPASTDPRINIDEFVE